MKYEEYLDNLSVNVSKYIKSIAMDIVVVIVAVAYVFYQMITLEPNEINPLVLIAQALMGIICGVVGSVIIILDEKKIKENENKESSMKEYVIGVISIILNIVLSSFNNITNKYMAPRVSIYTQMLYSAFLS